MARYELNLGPEEIQNLDKIASSAVKHSKQYRYAKALLACDRGPFSKKPHLSYQKIANKYNIHLLTLLNIRKNFLIYGVDFLRNCDRINRHYSISNIIYILYMVIYSKDPNAIKNIVRILEH